MGSLDRYNSFEEDQCLWIRYKNRGDTSSFEKLFKKYYPQLTRFSWRYVKSRAVAEEIVQDFFADIWENGKEMNIQGTIRSYFYKAVRNKSLNYNKYKEIKTRLDPLWMEQEQTSTIAFRDEMRVRQIKKTIEEAIETLPERGKMTYKLHRFDGLTYEEIAGVMGISVKTVESQMSRSLRMLRKHLAYLLPFLITALMPG